MDKHRYTLRFLKATTKEETTMEILATPLNVVEICRGWIKTTFGAMEVQVYDEFDKLIARYSQRDRWKE